MNQKTVGIDLGTNSLGITIRNIDLGTNFIDQLEYYSSDVFKSGVGKDKSGEYSYAAKRTEYRSTRRRYMVRKYRIWATLQLLIDQGYCPMKQNELDRWKRYDKKLGLKRQYPVDATEFEQWIKLDFNGDGKPDYSSPYQLRAELMERQFDFTQQVERYKLGRAIYHIAQRRGFKSSKGETINDNDKEKKTELKLSSEVEADTINELKASENKKSKFITDYMQEHKLTTVGCAMAMLEQEGIRIRGSEYTPIRAQYKEEIIAIFSFQKQLRDQNDFLQHVISEQKSEGTIFYKRPLRSQKGLVGKCTFEPQKPRCPISHPDFEDYRAWSFVNNIKYRASDQDAWRTLNLKQKQRLIDERFFLVRNYFKFEDIRKWIEKELNLKLNYHTKTINYKDSTSVSGCPISARLKRILGTDWRTWQYESNEERTNIKTGEIHKRKYNYEDLWHICFSYEEYEAVGSFAKKKLSFNDDLCLELQKMWGSIQQGYCNLSLKAIRNINRFLHKGLIFSDAVLLAKIPDILGDDYNDILEKQLLDNLGQIIETNRQQRRILNTANNLIAQYKAKNIEDQQAYKDTNYELDSSDIRNIELCIKETWGASFIQKLPLEKQAHLFRDVSKLYQSFFESSSREYYSLPRIGDAIQEYLINTLQNGKNYHWEKLYHPSMIETFTSVQSLPKEINGRMMGVRLLPSPSLGSIRNPMALRTLNILRRKINALILSGYISEDTKIVVETTRELNDANMRWAIETYQKRRNNENEEFRKLIEELHTGYNCTDKDIDKVRLLFDQSSIGTSIKPLADKEAKAQLTQRYSDKISKNDIDRYRLWKEQGCFCIYTGRPISLSQLFNGNNVDFEHTIPRSISFDDSLQNLTVCDSHFNRTIKGNKIPSELENYDQILTRIQPWIEKVEHLKDQVEFWRGQSKRAMNKERKDQCIRQKHLWNMELEYWKAKVERFLICKDDLTLGFRNSQLVDTRIITKYAYHYLKSAFNNVEVQKGNVTALFRKIVGIQSVDEKKDRSLHSHHAIDAAILTLIPSAAKRDRMIQLFYEIEESKQNGTNFDIAQRELQHELAGCHLGHIDSQNLIDTIQQNILVNHITKDRTLEPAKRRRRVNGKIVEGQYVQGASIRGSLHKDTFYGAIKYPETKDGKPITKNGQWKYPQGDDNIWMVQRVPIKDITEKDLPSIINPEVRNAIQTALKKHIPLDSIYLLDKDGNEIKQDKIGRPILPIRHVRCRSKAGVGYFTHKTAIELKKQNYLSDKEYKQHYYVQNDSNFLLLIYEGEKKGKIERKYRFINYIEIASLAIKSTDVLFELEQYKTYQEGYLLKSILKAGDRVLMWVSHPNELKALDTKDLSKRLYTLYKFNNAGSDYAYLRHHLTSNAEKESEKTSFDTNQPAPLLKLSASKFNVLVENKDFDIDLLGNITFKQP